MKNWLLKRPRKKLSKTKLNKLKERLKLALCRQAVIDMASSKSSVRKIFKVVHLGVYFYNSTHFSLISLFTLNNRVNNYVSVINRIMR